MNTVSNTAYYCCGVRMLDAEGEFSLIGDHFAKRFMDERGRMIFEPFRSERMANVSNAARCRIIDDLLRVQLASEPGTQVVSIGAGFDTRPYRLEGGSWLEIDEQAILDFKEKRLPASEAANPLLRVTIDFAQESLESRLNSVDPSRPVVVVIEGVFMYLTAEAIDTTLTCLKQAFPGHVLICDLMNKAFFEKYAYKVHKKLVEAGGTFTDRTEHPGHQFLAAGYEQTHCMPMFQRALELGAMKAVAGIPSPIVWLLLNLVAKDMNGYAVHAFRDRAGS